jgi:hypothetical protein
MPAALDRKVIRSTTLICTTNIRDELLSLTSDEQQVMTRFIGEEAGDDAVQNPIGATVKVEGAMLR